MKSCFYSIRENPGVVGNRNFNKQGARIFMQMCFCYCEYDWAQDIGDSNIRPYQPLSFLVKFFPLYKISG